ncbi:HGL098Cp [Eremothecium sinecaudum]|uniref:HGL098Cp n=1 Tax=Eremothecium sinecaudum TaxID=45286 RepID=A0A0X8HVI3_9SACH|nr:HGL098Cp [Eremothecium sinecaudum]AMD22242.1 HGL098Cp [Eremothecium sinecaudum]
MAKNSNSIEKLAEAPLQFVREGSAFISKCNKPNQKEFMQIVRAVGIGFLGVGVIGYAIKLIHIPIRYLIV